MYTQSKFLYKIASLDNTALTSSYTSYAWIPAKRWEVAGMVFVPTTAIGACSTPAVFLARLTPSGGSIATKITLSITASTAVGTEIAGTAYATGSDNFDVNASDTVTIANDTYMSGGGTTGAGDLYLVLREKPA